MLGSAGSIVPKRWVLGIFALGLIAVMVATSATQWAGAATVPTSVTASAVSATSVKVEWTAVDSGSTVPAGGTVDSYSVSCTPSGGTATTATVSGISASSHTFTGLSASTTYTCTVAAVATGSTPGTAVSASAVTTPADLSKQLGSVSISPSSGVKTVDDTLTLVASAKGADSSQTAITSGLTFTWSSATGGSVSPTSGTVTTYTAGSEGSVTVTVSVSQSSTGITKTATATITNKAKPTPEPAPVLAPIEESVEVVLDEQIESVLEDFGLSTDDANAGGGVISATKPVAIAVEQKDDPDATDPTDPSADPVEKESAGLSIPAGATGNDGVAVTVVQQGFDSFAEDALDLSEFVQIDDDVPAGSTDNKPVVVSSSAVTIQLRDSSGNTYDEQLTESATVSLSVPLATVQDADVDYQSLTLYKSETGKAPWTKVNSTVRIVGGKVEISGTVRNFSVFIIVSEPRELGVPGTPGAGPILPSAGDVAPTTTQALLLTGLGLVLIAGGGLYVRRQRRAGASH